MQRDGILALVSDPDVSHTAHRITRPFRALQSAGIDADILRLGPRGTDGIIWNPQIASIPIAETVGLIVLPRVMVPAEYRPAFIDWRDRLRVLGVALAAETDDDVYTEAWAEHHLAARGYGLTFDEARRAPHLARAAAAYADYSAEAAWLLAQVDGVTVSTEHLATVVRQYTSATVIVVPNAIDVDAFRAGLSHSPPWAEYLTIGWAGGYRPDADLLPVAEAWRRIAARYQNVHFVVAGWQSLPLVGAVPKDRLHAVSFMDMANYPMGYQVDIGCCAVADTAFNRSRSPIKAWEYALAGAAVVASSLVYGYDTTTTYADCETEWEHALAWLIEDDAARAWEREDGPRRIVDRHALSVNLHRWTDAYAEIRREMLALHSATVIRA